MTELERIKIAVKALISLGIAKNQEGLGILMGYKNKSSFSQILNGFVPLPADFIDRLCNLDNRLVKTWIVNEQGDVLRGKNQSSQTYIDESVNLIREPNEDKYKLDSQNNSIPLISFETIREFNKRNVRVKETERFIIPTFKRADYLVAVRGSSMNPKFVSGDIVACKHLALDTFFQWNKVYVLDTEQGVLINRVCKGSGENNVLVVSDNSSYDSFELKKQDIRALALVIGVISVD